MVPTTILNECVPVMAAMADAKIATLLILKLQGAIQYAWIAVFATLAPTDATTLKPSTPTALRTNDCGLSVRPRLRTGISYSTGFVT